jgi:glycosyltransferase 2 family protein
MSKGLKWLLVALKVGFSVGLFVWLFSRFNARDAMREALHEDVRWLWAAVAVFFVSNLVGSWLWGRLLKMQGVVIPFPRIAAYYFVGLFFNNFLPANIAGDFARISAAREHSDSSAPVFSATLMDRMVGGLAVALMAMVSVGLAWPWFHDLRVDALVTGLFLLSVLMYLAVFRRDVLGWVEWPFRALRLNGLEDRIARLMDDVHAYRDRPGELMGLLAVGLLVQIMRVMMHFSVARALGLRIPIGAIFTFVPILAAIVMLPISLNGIGVREGAAVLLFRLVGLSGAQSISFQLLTWLLAVAVSLLGGLIFVLRAPLRTAAARREI